MSHIHKVFDLVGNGYRLQVTTAARRDVISSSCLDGPARPESILSLGQRRLQSRNKKAPFSRRKLHTFPALRSQETKPPSSPQSGPTTNEPRQPGMTYADPSLLNSSSPSFPNFLQTSGEQTQPEPKRYVQGTGLTEEQLVNAVLSKKAGKDATVRIVGDQSGASSPAESSAHLHPGPGQPNPSPQMQQPGFSPSESQSAVRQLGLHPSTNLNQSATTFSAPLSWSSMMDRLKGVFGQGDRLRAAANSTEHYPNQQQPQPGFAHPQQQQQPSSNYQQWPQGHPQQFSSQNPYPAAMGPAGIASPGGQAGGFPPPPPPPSGNGASNGTSQPGHGSQPFASTAPPEPIRVVIEEGDPSFPIPRRSIVISLILFLTRAFRGSTRKPGFPRLKIRGNHRHLQFPGEPSPSRIYFLTASGLTSRMTISPQDPYLGLARPRWQRRASSYRFAVTCRIPACLGKESR